MTLTLEQCTARGRLFKLFTELGPYFRKLQSTEFSFFFDCLEVCVDVDKEPEEREFYGWWLLVDRDENGFHYQRFDGLYNLAGKWVEQRVTAHHQQQLDKSFELFVKRLATLIDLETGEQLEPLAQVVLSEV